MFFAAREYFLAKARAKPVGLHSAAMTRYGRLSIALYTLFPRHLRREVR